MRSSYKQNDYGCLFRALVRVMKPTIVFEFGTLDGYSAINIGEALRQNGRGVLYCWDIWDRYQYTSATKEETQERIKRFGLEGIVILLRGEASKVLSLYENLKVDMIHIDVSNDGDVVKTLIPKARKALRDGGVLLFEGGSKARDSGWIKKYKKKPIQEELKKVKGFEVLTIDPYPSLTVMKKCSS